MAMKLTAPQKLERAHVALLRNEHTLIMAGILMMGKSEIHPTFPTAATNGLNKYYGEKFVDSLDEAELRCVVVHENIHVMFKHLRVWKPLFKQNQYKANVAADYVVNGFIKKLDPSETFLKPPKNKPPAVWLQNDKFDGLDVGEVYRRLKDEDMPQGGGEGEGSGGFDCHDLSGFDEMTEKQIEEVLRDIDQAIRQGSMIAGKMFQGKDRTFDGLLEPKVDWRRAMREFITSYCDGRDESTWRRPSRRWLQYDTYMPSMQGVAVGDIGIFVDTSGSTYVGGMLEKFMSEVNAICTTVMPDKLHLVYWEHTIAGYETYTREQMGSVVANTRVKGGGGTTLSCVTNFIEEKQLKLKCAVVITDGYVGSDWGGHWTCPVLWVIIGNKNAHPPQGVVVHAADD